MSAQGRDRWDWGQFDVDEWLLHVGRRLEALSGEGHAVDWYTDLYKIAEDMVGEEGEDADRLCDEANDALTDLQRIIVWFQFTGGFGMFAGISLVDFGSNKLFVFELPVEDLGIDLTLLSVVERDDSEGIGQAANHLMERGWVPNRISIKEPITREAFKAAYQRGLNTSGEGEWDNLSTMMSSWGHSLPYETDDEREQLLEAYLSLAFDE